MQDFLTNCANVLQKYGFSYLRGAGTTLLLALVGTFFGCLIGFAVGALQTIPVDKQRDPVWKRVLLKILHIFLRCYVELFRGTPMIVQAVFIYYGLLQVFGIKMGMWQAGVFIVSINTGAYMAETVRGGIVSIDPGQTEGAKAIGMNHWQTMLHVIMPQALRNIIPQIGNNFIINIKDTSVLSVISITAQRSAGSQPSNKKALSVPTRRLFASSRRSAMAARSLASKSASRLPPRPAMRCSISCRSFSSAARFSASALSFSFAVPVMPRKLTVENPRSRSALSARSFTLP